MHSGLQITGTIFPCPLMNGSCLVEFLNVKQVVELQVKQLLRAQDLQAPSLR